MKTHISIQKFTNYESRLEMEQNKAYQIHMKKMRGSPTYKELFANGKELTGEQIDRKMDF